SCILFQNDSRTAVLLDLPRSIEEAQVLSSRLAPTATSAARRSAAEEDVGTVDGTHRKKLRALVSAAPLAVPFPTPESKVKDGDGDEYAAGGPATADPAVKLAELMTLATVEAALEDIKRSSYDGLWCLPRYYHPPTSCSSSTAKQQDQQQQDPLPSGEPGTETTTAAAPTASSRPDTEEPTHGASPSARYLLGSISQQREAFLAAVPPASLDLIVLDPPWPNRSAQRKRKRGGGGGGDNAAAYQTAGDAAAVCELLSLVPVASRLAADGLVAVWVTNSPSRSADLLVGPRGIFSQCWDVELVGEWIWLKVTSRGEPVVPLASAWRKPWERLLIARKRRTTAPAAGAEARRLRLIPTKVIVTVPDVHSRKPNLRHLFEEEPGLLPPDGEYRAMEVFARNLTAGWWAWGDQVLLFQHRDHW
ncbi:MT-A70-domain-containing protein, partial [Lasiosphaeria miniovina]